MPSRSPSAGSSRPKTSSPASSVSACDPWAKTPPNRLCHELQNQDTSHTRVQRRFFGLPCTTSNPVAAARQKHHASPGGVPSVPTLRADPCDVGSHIWSLQREVILMLLFADHRIRRDPKWVFTCCFVDLPHLLQQQLECRAVRPHHVAMASLAFPARKQVLRVAVVRR